VKRTDYAANRGPLDGREYTRRRPDPFSTVAGCLVFVMVFGIGLVLAGMAVSAVHP
jgi:hypothetical protein